MPGMHGTVSAVAALQKADLLITLGARFDDRVTGQLDTFAPEAKVIHADVDPAEISKNRLADVPIVGSLKEIVPELQSAYEDLCAREGAPDLTAWWRQLSRIRETYPLGWTSRRTATSLRRRSSRGSAGRPARRPFMWPASDSTRCGPPSSSPMSVRASG